MHPCHQVAFATLADPDMCQNLMKASNSHAEAPHVSLTTVACLQSLAHFFAVWQWPIFFVVLLLWLVSVMRTGAYRKRKAKSLLDLLQVPV